LIQKNLVEAQRGIDDLMAKMESTAINSKQTLRIVKNTTSLVCHSTDDRIINKTWLSTNINNRGRI
jgi:hypothetical protein